MNRPIIIGTLIALLLMGSRAFAQPGSKNFDKVWVQGGSVTFSTKFDSGKAPENQIISLFNPLYFIHGNSGICDSAGNLLLVCDGYSLYDKNLHIIDSGQNMAPWRITRLTDEWSGLSQTSIILPFAHGKYRLITPTVSDDSCFYNWEHIGSGNGSYFDLLLYDEVDMNANGGAGKVTKRMAPLLQNVRLSKTQMMACRHGDGKSWWLLKRAADTNMVYKFLFTEDRIYGPYIQGFSGVAARFGEWDVDGQAMFSKDGTKYATTQLGYGKVFIADFDRCTGMLSNPKVYKLPARHTGNPGDTTEKDSTTCGLSFSPSGRYLYVSSLYNIQQFDLKNPVSPLAWTLLSGPDTARQEFQQYSNIYPGPDGKLYIGNWNGLGGEMSVIDLPDNYGTGAGFCRKCLRFPGFLYDSVFRFAAVGTPPCMPDYSLGPASPICYPTGVSTPVTEESSFTLYPNPSQGIIEVKSSEAGVLHLYDMTGSTVSSAVLSKAGSSTSIDVGNLPAGIYQYRFMGSSGHSKAGKLVIK